MVLNQSILIIFTSVSKNKKQILTFYSTFKYYLNKYELDGVRKYRIDCLIKRAKSKFIKSILLEHILTSSICFINYYS